MSTDGAGPAGHSDGDGPPGAPFLPPQFEARLEPDIVIMDAVNSFLIDEPPGSVRATTAEIVTLDTVEAVSPTFLFLLRSLLSSKGATSEYTPGTHIREVMMSVLHVVTTVDNEPSSATPRSTGHPEQRPPSRSASDIEREQREYLAYQQRRRGAPQVFAHRGASGSGVPGTAVSQRFGAGPREGSGFPARTAAAGAAESPTPLRAGPVSLPETRGNPEETQTSSRAPTFRVASLPHANPQGVHARMGDLIKSYARDMNYTGRDSEYQSLARFQQAYTSKCALFNLTDGDALHALLISINQHSPAGEYYYRHVKDNPAVTSLGQAFGLLSSWYRSQSRVADLTDEWDSLRFMQFRSAGVTMRQAMEKLYEKAVHFQSRLDAIHQSDELLVEVLRKSVRDEHFSLFIDYNEASRSSREFYQRCMNAIRKQEWRDSKQAIADRQSGRQPESSSQDTV